MIRLKGFLLLLMESRGGGIVMRGEGINLWGGILGVLRVKVRGLSA